MIKVFFRKIKTMFTDSSLRKRLFFLLGLLIVFRFLANIPIPGIDQLQLEVVFSQNQFLGLLNIFSGGGLSALSIVMLGVGPYITASIIMQLLTMASPKLKELYHESGEDGRRKFSRLSRYLTVPLAIFQAFGFILLLQQQSILPADLTTLVLVTNIIVIATGSILLMWLGELATEFALGRNGVSIIIFAGIIASLPGVISQFVFSYDPSQLPTIIAFVAIAIVTIISVVLITEAERTIPVTYAKQVRGGETYGATSSYIPLRLNQAGVIPIIFAISILLFPQMLINFLGGVDNAILQNVLGSMESFLANQVWYGVLYFLLVFVFTYFYTAVTFEPDTIAKNLQRGGAFIPGIRPGEATALYISKVLTRITFVGALFLGLIAVMPLVVQYYSGISSLSIGGTALLIVVSVVIDLIKKTDAQLSMKEY